MSQILNLTLTGVLALTMLVSKDAAANGKFRVLYSFKGGSDGADPFGTPLADQAGNLYGTTYFGGGGTGCNGNSGCGTVFKLTQNGTEAVLYAFKGGNDGEFPYDGLVADNPGNVYGTTQDGGGTDCGGSGCGTAFKVTTNGIETVLHAFTGGSDGATPQGSLVIDGAGNLYGVTSNGGVNGDGTVFKITPGGKETVLFSFNGDDGFYPAYVRLLLGPKQTLYGTTQFGGGYDAGTVFALGRGRTETVLYSFTGGSDGGGPFGGLVDVGGALYGTTEIGGTDGCGSYGSCGTVFKVTPKGNETVLYSFKGGNDGSNPFAAVVTGKKGNLYGTTIHGGGTGCSGGGCGTVFKVAVDGSETVLHAFAGESDGCFPTAGLIADKRGNLYGATGYCGAGYGTIFKLDE